MSDHMQTAATVGTLHRSDSDHGLSLGDIFRTLGRHLLLIGICVIVALALSTAYIVIKKPIYEATATLRIDPARASSLGVSEVGGGAVDATSLINTEIAVILSDGVSRRVLSSLPSDAHPDYLHDVKDIPAPSQSAQSLTEDQQDLLDEFKSHLIAKQVEGTQLIAISFRDHNPATAATVVNLLLRAYTTQNFEDRDSSVSQLRAWLSAQMADLQNQVEASQKKLSAFQEANNILGTEGTSTTVTDRLRLLNDSLAAAQANRITKEAALRAARAGDVGALAALFPNPHLEALQREQATQATKAAQLASKFGPNYPPLLEAKKELVELDAEVTRDVQSVQHRLQQEFDAAKTTQAMLQDEYNKQTQQGYMLNRNEAEYAVLQANVLSSRELYDTLRRKLQQAGVDAEVNGLNTIPIDNARVPTDPVLPKKLLILIGSIIVGLIAGAAASFIYESRSREFIIVQPENAI